MLDHLDHIAIAVKNIEDKILLYEEVFGFSPLSREELPSEKVKVAFMAFEQAKLELIEPTSQESSVHKFIEKKGEGLHHICFQVDVLEEAMEVLLSKGVDFIMPAPRIGAGGHRIAFIHPKSAGILIELKEKKQEK